MKTVKEITDNLVGAIDTYESLDLDDVLQLSEILRILDVNLSCLVILRDEYYKKYQSTYFNSKGTSSAAKNKEAEMLVPELDFIRKVLKHYSDVQGSVRSQISLRKKIDR
ncbi:MAG: hypothetical protein ACFFKA_20325 [Candidatus Thorarchaeota archaeon]